MLTAHEAELVPALAQGLLLFGEVDVLGATGANSGHLGSLDQVPRKIRITILEN